LREGYHIFQKKMIRFFSLQVENQKASEDEKRAEPPKMMYFFLVGGFNPFEKY